MRFLEFGCEFVALFILEFHLDHSEIAIIRILAATLADYYSDGVIECWKNEFLPNLIWSAWLEQFAALYLLAQPLFFLADAVADQADRKFANCKWCFFFEELGEQIFNICVGYLERRRPVSGSLSLQSQHEKEPPA